MFVTVFILSQSGDEGWVFTNILSRNQGSHLYATIHHNGERLGEFHHLAVFLPYISAPDFTRVEGSTLVIGASERTRTSTGFYSQQVLSLSCLPIPPQTHVTKSGRDDGTCTHKGYYPRQLLRLLCFLFHHIPIWHPTSDSNTNSFVRSEMSFHQTNRVSFKTWWAMKESNLRLIYVKDMFYHCTNRPKLV